MRARTMPGRRGGSVAAEHAEWLGLIDVSGPFLSIKVLLEAFPQGLDREDPELAKNLRQRLNEWQDNLELRKRDPGTHDSFVRFVLRELLELPADLLQEGPQIPPTAKATLSEYRVTLAPKFTVGASGQTPVLLIDVQAPGTGLDKALPERGFHASPNERMRLLLRHTGVKSGLVTNGEKWTLVHTPGDRTATFATWDANDLLDERLTLRAFRSLLGRRRLIDFESEDTLDGLLERSRDDEREVTDQLGNQVRRAVELLVSAIDRTDRDTDGAVVEEVRLLERNEQAERTIYEAVVTTCMRLIFLLAAEARGLLPDDEPWIESYAVTPLRAELQQIADRTGEELLDRRFDAWPRLLSTFRAVHGGVEHERVRLPGYGGGLFDPARYPFLEIAGRQTLRISNRVILRVLDAIQTLQVDVPGGGKEPRPLSYTGLGVEQIGHVYERLLDHTAIRADAPAVGLVGTAKKEPEIAIALLDQARADGEDKLLDLLTGETGRSRSALKRALDSKPALERADALAQACGHDSTIIEQIRPHLSLVRDDAYGSPTVFLPGSIYVTESRVRAATGTHYTPPSLTEPIVQSALEPVVYRGPADGRPREEWELKSPEELLALKVCDIAMGSGAFLVAACRYLGARLVEAWEKYPEQALADAGRDFEERRLTAMRIVAERCLYGVDVNPLAVEIAKVSLWLTTLRRDRPFTFVDHALRCGDSLLGLTSLDQLEALTLKPKEVSSILLEPVREAIRATLDEVRQVRERIEATDALDLREVDAKAAALSGAGRELHALRVVGDLIVGAELEEVVGKGKAATVVEAAADEIRRALAATDADRRGALLAQVEARAGDTLMAGRVPGVPDRPRPFHWALEFPEVFERANGGFDAIVGNPPFQGGKKISGTLGSNYRNYLVEDVASGAKGNADLVAYFFLRAARLVRPSGTMGLLATNTISQGDTREVGLDQMCAAGWTISMAWKSRPWPGEASLEVAQLWLYRGKWDGRRELDGRSVFGITSLLDVASRVAGLANGLAGSGKRSFIGSYVNGIGFVLEPDEAQELISRDARNVDVLFPYLTGEDLNSRSDLSPSRWVINFRDWPLDRAAEYPLALDIIRDRVKPHRDRVNRKAHRQYWWHYGDKRPLLYDTIEELDRVIAIARVSKTVTPAFVPTGIVYSDAVVVFGYDDDVHLGVLTSGLHWWWVIKYTGTLRTDATYRPTDCFETFPQPELTDEIGSAAKALDNHRGALMLERNEGLTKTYNRVHNPNEVATEIEDLRQRHVELDRVVAAAYGWDDLFLDHGSYETPQGLRFTIGQTARVELLDRLLELNLERYTEEVARGLHGTGSKKAKKAGRRGPSRRDGTIDDTLFD